MSDQQANDVTEHCNTVRQLLMAVDCSYTQGAVHDKRGEMDAVEGCKQTVVAAVNAAKWHLDYIAQQVK